MLRHGHLVTRPRGSAESQRSPFETFSIRQPALRVRGAAQVVVEGGAHARRGQPLRQKPQRAPIPGSRYSGAAALLLGDTEGSV